MRGKILSNLCRCTMGAMLLVLSACRVGLSGPGNNATPIKNPADIHVGFVAETMTENFALEMLYGAQYAAKQFNVSAQIMAPASVNPTQELNFFNGLTQTARDGIAVETLEPDLFVTPETNAVSSGIPVIAVDTIASKVPTITTYIGNDNVTAGAMLAQATIDRLSPAAKGVIMIGNDHPGVPVLDYRVQGMQQVFKSQRPDLQLVTPFNAQELPDPNHAAWNSAVNAYPDAIACLGTGDSSVASLATIKQATHGTYLASAFNLNEAGLQAVANGTIFALADPEHFLKGYVAMRLLIEHALYGNAIPKGWWNPGAMLVTQNNVQAIITRQSSPDNRGKYFQPIIDQEFANPSAVMKPLDQAK